VPAELEVQGIPVSELARRFGTPLFVYDADVLTEQYLGLRDRLHPAMEMFFSLKANPNASVCRLLNSLGARAEVSSLAELTTALRVGVRADDIIFPGPGKSVEELTECLDTGVFAIICESLEELDLIDRMAARRGVVARVALRVNPGFAIKGAKLSMGGKPRQFGIDEAQLLSTSGLTTRLRATRIIGVHVYLGTRILDEQIIVANTEKIFDLADRVADHLGIPLEMVDIGGGLGVAYFEGERDLDPIRLTDELNPVIDRYAARHPGTRLIMELGRYLAAPAGTYIAEVRYTKRSMDERFAIVDGGTHHHMAAVGIGSFVKRNFPIRLISRIDEPAEQAWTIAGPLCTPNDTLGSKVALPELRPGDLIGVFRSGAYGPTASPVMFLSHGYPAEVMVHGGRAHLVRERDSVADLIGRQPLPDFSTPRAETAG